MADSLTHEERLDTLSLCERTFVQCTDTFKEALKARATGAAGMRSARPPSFSEGIDYDSYDPCQCDNEETRKAHKCEVYRTYGKFLVSMLPYVSACDAKLAIRLQLYLWELSARMEELNDSTGGNPKNHILTLGHLVLPHIFNIEIALPLLFKESRLQPFADSQFWQDPMAWSIGDDIGDNIVFKHLSSLHDEALSYKHDHSLYEELCALVDVMRHLLRVARKRAEGKSPW